MKSPMQKKSAFKSLKIITNYKFQFLIAFGLLLLNTSMADEIIIGNGTQTDTHKPTEAFYDYSYTQQIFLQSEIGKQGTIDSIYFYWTGNANRTRTVVVYMAHTTKGSFTSSTDWVSSTGLTRVYSGSYSLTSTAGWHKIVLDVPFTYNNSDNLLIAFDDNTNSFASDNDEFYATNYGAYRSLYAYQDNNNILVASPTGASYSGRSTSCANLRICITSSGPTAPVIATQPVSDTVVVGGIDTFSVFATGNPAPSYQWQKFTGSIWGDIAGATTFQYTISTAAKTDSTQFRATVSNSAGSDTSNAVMLLVYNPPVITTNPTDRIIAVGQTATFTAAATGDHVQHQWEERPPGGSWSSISGADSASYTTPIATAGMDGTQYRCNATGLEGTSAQSNSATLQVSQTIKPEIRTDLYSSYQVIVNTDTLLEISAVGLPPLSYQWEKQNGPIWDTLVGDTMKMYQIKSMNSAHVGSYRVRVWNDSGTVTSANASITMADSVRIIRDPVNDTVLAGQQYKFSIQATGGVAAINYQWQRRVGGGFQDISGANDSVYTDTAGSADDGAWFQCRIWSGPFADTSLVGILSLGLAPAIKVSPRDSVLPVKADLTLGATDTGFPTPKVKWYFAHPSTGTPVVLDSSVTFNPTYKLEAATKSDSGYYYCVATNRFGSVVSDTAFIHVLNPVTVVDNIPLSYNTIHGGAVAFGPTATGDGKINYQWYKDNIIQPGDTNRTYSISPVDSATHDGKQYHCAIFNQFRGTLNGTPSTITISLQNTNVCVLNVGQYYNPFTLVVERVDSLNIDEARVKLSSLVDISNFPYAPSPTQKYADSVWIYYKTVSKPTLALYDGKVSVATEKIVKTSPNTFEDTILVGILPEPNDSLYHFSYSVKWHNKDTLLPLQEANSVLFVDTNAIKNVLNVYANYYIKSDSVLFVIDSIENINSADSLRLQTVIIEYSNYSDFSVVLGGIHLPGLELFDSTGSYSRMITGILDNNFEKHVVYVRWYLKGKDGSQSGFKYYQFVVGWDRPVWNGDFTVTPGSRSNRLNISWQNNQQAEFIKFWYSTDTIPFTYDHDILLQETGNTPKVLINPTATNDSIMGLTNATHYYVSAQIYRDSMWSRISKNSTDTATTDTFDIDQKVPNVIKIDTTWFDTTTNDIVIDWHINLAQNPPPPNSIYKVGYSYTKLPFIDPVNSIIHGNDSVKTDTNVTRIRIPDLIWDTTYTLGLWLWFEAQLGESKKAEPTDTSKTFAQTPSFTWQVVRLFPEYGVPEIIPAANGKVLFKEQTEFSQGGEQDTIRAFGAKALPLPEGLCKIDALSFRFCRHNNKPYIVPPFTIEIPYSSLPPGISEEDLGIYRYINGKVYAVHGFKRGNGTVSVEIAKEDLNLNGSYPFLVLADTIGPSIISVNNVEKVARDVDITSKFTVIDNIANAKCNFLYGHGKEALSNAETFTLTSDTAAVKRDIKSTSTAVNSSFGTRILLIADDGIRKDTVNASRSILSDNVDNFSIPEMEWAPLRVGGSLTDPSTFTNFDQSSSEPWTYDTKKIRLFRFYDPSPTSANSYMEYSEENKAYFEFIGGRLIWCKARESLTLRFGAGYTTSLREPFVIRLKAKSWTDFCLPFQFSIALKDVKAATGVLFDSLDFYHWEKNTTTYTTAPMRLGLIDMNKPLRDTLLSQHKNDGYTVYNNHSVEIRLLIPPISLPLSSPDHVKSRAGDEIQDAAWDMRLLWKEKKLHNRYQTVICAYNKNIGDRVIYGSLPPGMDRIKSGILNSLNNSIHGYAINGNTEKGGMYFTIGFRNKSDNTANIEYCFDKLDPLPEGYVARVLNPNTRAYETCDDTLVSELDIPPGSDNIEKRLVVIGTSDYLNDILSWISPAAFAFLKAYPNPFSGTIRMHYTLPPDILEVQITLYNVLGRRLWRSVQRTGISSGEHVFTFNSRNALGNNGILPTGVYILRLSAKNKAGKLIFGGDKRITCIK